MPLRVLSMAIVATLVWGALAFGAPYPWAFTPLAIAASIVGVIGMLRGPMPVPRLTLMALAVVGSAATLQMVPVPPDVAMVVSPARERLLLEYDVTYAWNRESQPARPLSISPSRTGLAVALFASFTLLLAGTTRIATRENVRTIAHGVTALGVLLALVALAQRAMFAERVYGFWRPEMSDTFFGPFVNKNHFAGWMLMAIPLGIGLLGAHLDRALRGERRSIRERVLWLSSPQANQLVLVGCALLAMVLSLVMTLSRSGIAALAAAFVLSMTFASRHASRSRRIIGVGYVAAVAAIVVGWVGADAILQHFANADTASFNGRIPIWNDTWRIVRDFWMTGTGLNTYGVATLFYQTTLPGLHLAEAHNDYLQLAAEGGVLLGVPVLLAVVLFTCEVHGRMSATEGSTYWLRLGAIAPVRDLEDAALAGDIDLVMRCLGALVPSVAARHEPARVS